LCESAENCIAGQPVSSRRVAGTRNIELDIGADRPHIEIELQPSEADRLDRNRVAFKPTRWKLFRS
ncbi:TOBE-like domain-containing protein, partial [Rhizobium johnstonii]|uniref:TOBE-like domain-containing protein n=1 Tax=Rhizobium johnstonii TaxID=3019933 RepID=UPI003F9620C6